MTCVRFTRHTFRGLDIPPDQKEIRLIGAKPSLLLIPPTLKRIKKEDALLLGLPERAQTMTRGLTHTSVLADFSTERTFVTGEQIASSSCGFLIGAPTTYDKPIDPVVVVVVGTAKIDNQNPDVMLAKGKVAKKLSTVACKTFNKFLYNLGIKYDGTSSIGEDDFGFLKLPSWVDDLASVIELGCGIPNRSIEEIITGAGWPKPRYPKKLFKQAILLKSFKNAIQFPAGSVGNLIASGPALDILVFLQSLYGIGFRISHDNLISPLLIALGLGHYYPIDPLQQIQFTLERGRLVVDQYNFTVGKSGSVYTKRIYHKHVATISIERLEFLAFNCNRPPNPQRIMIPV